MHRSAIIGLAILGVFVLLVVAGNVLRLVDPEGSAQRQAELAAPAPTTVPTLPTRAPISVVTIVSAPSTPTPRPTTVPGITSGTETRIRTNGISQIHLAIDEVARDEWRDFTTGNDRAGAERMIAAGHMFPVADRTRVVTLRHVMPLDGMAHVRVLEGEHAGREGWIQSSFIR